MKVVGLITEYNPFHNGHLYHLQKAKELTGADYTVVVMSGDFVQRGAPAMFHKYLRTQMALSAGADLVLELPTVFATSSAEDFAAGAVAVLDRLGIVDYLCFGSECGDTAKLDLVADIFVREPEEYTMHLKDFLRQGISYPEARQQALSVFLPQENESFGLLGTPNNILGIEYLKALKKRSSQITPCSIARAGSGYHDTGLDKVYSSATAIRHILSSPGSKSAVHEKMPEEAFQLISGQMPMLCNDLTFLLNQTILALSAQQAAFSDYADISEDLEARLKGMTLDFDTFDQRVTKLKTKQYTYTRISRGLLHLLLGIKKEDLACYKEEDYVTYLRVLGFQKSSSPLLAAIKENSSLPLITKTADADGYLTPTGTRMFHQDLYCSHVYKALYQSKTGILLPNEYTQPLVIL